MKCRMVVLALSVLACLTSSFADSFAQDSTAPQSAPAPPKVKVYLAGFSEGTEHAFEGPADLKNFVNTYLYLRFSQINNASLTSELPDASCGPEQSSVRRSIQPQALAPHVPDSLSFYTIRGSLETHPHDPLAGADDVVINYELLKTVRCTPQVLLRRAEPVPQARLLDSLSVMADALAFRVGEDAAKRISIDVRTMLAEKASPDDAEFTRSLTDYLLQALAATDDLRPNESSKGNSNAAAEYALETHVTFPRSTNPLRGFSRSVEISLYLIASAQATSENAEGLLDSHKYTLTPTPIRGSANQRSQIFAQAADIAVRGIGDVHYAREAGLPEIHSTAEAVKKAKQLLCIESSQGGCVPEADAAISLLQKEPPNGSTLEWLGKAQYLSGRYTDAAQSFSSLLGSAPSLPLDEALRLNLASADAWYRARSFRNASEYYDAAAKLVGENPAVHSDTDFNLRRSSSRRFKGDNLGAIDALLDPVGIVENRDPLNREVEHIVDALSATELPEAIGRLERNAADGSNKTALSMAYRNQAGFQINDQHYAEAEATIQKALTLHDEKTLPNLNYLLSLAEFLGLQSQDLQRQNKIQYRTFSERLDPILKEDPTAFSYGPLALQLLLCEDYLEDLPCARRTIEYLDRSKAEPPVGIELDLIEMRVLDKDYDVAIERLNRALKLKGLDLSLRTVACFYQVWMALADGKGPRAEQWFQEWQDALKSVHKSGTPVSWSFGGAGRALQNEPELFSVVSRNLLTAMMRAMEDDKAQVPVFHR